MVGEVLAILARDVPSFIDQVLGPKRPSWWAGMAWTFRSAAAVVDAARRLEPKVGTGELGAMDEWEDYTLWLLCAYSRTRRRPHELSDAVLNAMQGFLDENAPEGVPLIAWDGRLAPAWVLEHHAP
jgi:hypothetical protein